MKLCCLLNRSVTNVYDLKAEKYPYIHYRLTKVKLIHCKTCNSYKLKYDSNNEDLIYFSKKDVIRLIEIEKIKLLSDSLEKIKNNETI